MSCRLARVYGTGKGQFFINLKQVSYAELVGHEIIFTTLGHKPISGSHNFFSGGESIKYTTMFPSPDQAKIEFESITTDLNHYYNGQC